MARRTKGLESTAYHEAGHAVVAFELEIPFESVTIAPDEESVGSMIYQRRLQKLDDYGSISARRRATLEAHVRVLIAGWIAEKRFNPKGFRRSGAQEDQRTLITIVFLLSNSEKEAIDPCIINGLAASREKGPVQSPAPTCLLQDRV